MFDTSSYTKNYSPELKEDYKKLLNTVHIQKIILTQKHNL